MCLLAYGKVNWPGEICGKKREDILQLIRERTDTNIFDVPTWQVGFWPEELDAQNDPDESGGSSRVDIADWNKTMDIAGLVLGSLLTPVALLLGSMNYENLHVKKRRS